MKKATFTIVNGPYKGRCFTANPGHRSVVGRAPSTDFNVMDRGMSREHFLIYLENERWFVRDLESANGTSIDETCISKRAICDGDTITAGHTSFRVSLTEYRRDDPHQPFSTEPPFP